MASVFIRERQKEVWKRQREERRKRCEKETEIRVTPRNKPRSANSHEKLDEARDGFSPRNFQRQHLDFRLVASTAVRK